MRRERLVTSWFVLALVPWLVGLLIHDSAVASEPRAKAQSDPTELSQDVAGFWHGSYPTARDLAIERRRLLMIVFHDESDSFVETWLRRLEADAEVRELLSGMVGARVPMTARVPEELTSSGSSGDENDGPDVAGNDGKSAPREVRLIDHDAFRELRGRPGVAIVDFRDEESAEYRQVISVLPADEEPGGKETGMWPKVSQIRTLLSLPDGSLTERTLIFAVRTHPDQPESTAGEWHPVLRDESRRHARYQAEIGVQGHHAWTERFHRINARLPSGVVAQEVCAESWSGQGLIAAARECVRSWRQSPGHWNAVSSRHLFFGYDMQRGANGVWYATGIFGRQR